MLPQAYPFQFQDAKKPATGAARRRGFLLLEALVACLLLSSVLLLFVALFQSSRASLFQTRCRSIAASESYAVLERYRALGYETLNREIGEDTNSVERSLPPARGLPGARGHCRLRRVVLDGGTVVEWGSTPGSSPDGVEVTAVVSWLDAAHPGLRRTQSHTTLVTTNPELDLEVLP